MKKFAEYLNENTLYTNAVEKNVLLTDTEKLMRLFYINFIGFFGLAAVETENPAIKRFLMSGGKLQLSNIRDTNSDLTILIKLLQDANLMTLNNANEITKLLSLIRDGKIKNGQLNEVIIVNLLKRVYITAGSNRPENKVLEVVKDLVDGQTNLIQSAMKIVVLIQTRYKDSTSELLDLLIRSGLRNKLQQASSAANLATMTNSNNSPTINTSTVSNISSVINPNTTSVVVRNNSSKPPVELSKNDIEVLINDYHSNPKDYVFKYGLEKKNTNLLKAMSYIITDRNILRNTNELTGYSFLWKAYVSGDDRFLEFIKEYDVSIDSFIESEYAKLMDSMCITTMFNLTRYTYDAKATVFLNVYNYLNDVDKLVRPIKDLVSYSASYKLDIIKSVRTIIFELLGVELDIDNYKQYKERISKIESVLGFIFEKRFTINDPKIDYDLGISLSIKYLTYRILIGRAFEHAPKGTFTAFLRKVSNLEYLAITEQSESFTIEENEIESSLIPFLLSFKVSESYIRNLLKMCVQLKIFELTPSKKMSTVDSFLVFMKKIYNTTNMISYVSSSNIIFPNFNFTEDDYTELAKRFVNDWQPAAVNRDARVPWQPAKMFFSVMSYSPDSYKHIFPNVAAAMLGQVPPKLDFSSTYPIGDTISKIFNILLKPENENLTKKVVEKYFKTGFPLFSKTDSSDIRFLKYSYRTKLEYDFCYTLCRGNNPDVNEVIKNFIMKTNFFDLYSNSSNDYEIPDVPTDLSLILQIIKSYSSLNKDIINNPTDSRTVYVKRIIDSSKQVQDHLLKKYKDSTSGFAQDEQTYNSKNIYDIDFITNIPDIVFDNYRLFLKSIIQELIDSKGYTYLPTRKMYKDPRFLKIYDEEVSKLANNKEIITREFNTVFATLSPSQLNDWFSTMTDSQMMDFIDTAGEDTTIMTIVEAVKEHREKLNLGIIRRVFNIIVEKHNSKPKKRGRKPKYEVNVTKDALDSLAIALVEDFKSGDKSSQFAINHLYEHISPEAKLAMTEVFLGQGTVDAAMKVILQDDNPIKPFVKLDRQRMETLLKYNKVKFTNVKKYKTPRTLQDLLDAQSDLANNLFKLKVKEIELKDDEKPTFYTRKTIEYERFRSGKHGSNRLEIIKEFDVTIEKQIEGQKKFRLDHPNTGVLNPCFSGTGSISASFILRFGFAVISSNDPLNTGRMLGDGIYVTPVIDKAGQYIGDTGFTRQPGTIGYLMQIEGLLGEEGKDYKAAGIGNDSIRSPEYCFFHPNEQLRIYKVFEVKIITKDQFDNIKKTLNENTDVVMKIQTFKEFIRESNDPLYKDATIYIFQDGQIPISNSEFIDFEFFDTLNYDKSRVRLEYGPEGPEIIINNNNGNNNVNHVLSTYKLLNSPPELKTFLDLLGPIS